MRIHRSKLAAWVLVVFGAIAAFFVVAEHRAHTFGALHYVLLALCLLLLYLLVRHEEAQPKDGASPTVHRHQDPP